MGNTVELSIGGQPYVLWVKEYNRQRVLTLREIEDAHQRYWGTASKTFQADRERFVEGKHFYYLAGSDAYDFATTHSVGTHPAKVRQLFLITEAGYLLLTEPFTDVLDREVKQQLVDRYFGAVEDAPRQMTSIVGRMPMDAQIERVFEYEGSKVRTVIIDGEPWFVAKDVCDVLEIGNSRQAVDRLDEDEKNTVILNDGTPGNPAKSIVSEAGLYSLVMASRKPEAKAFRRWIAHEVIPSIRKTGSYSQKPVSQLDALRQTVEILADQERRIASVEKRTEVLASRVDTLDGTALLGDPQQQFNSKIRLYALKRGIHYSVGYGHFIHRYNTSRRTNLRSRLHHYRARTGNAKATMPQYLAETGQIEDALRVVDKMLDAIRGAVN